MGHQQAEPQRGVMVPKRIPILRAARRPFSFFGKADFALTKLLARRMHHVHFTRP